MKDGEDGGLPALLAAEPAFGMTEEEYTPRRGRRGCRGEALCCRHTGNVKEEDDKAGNMVYNCRQRNKNNNFGGHAL